MTIKKTGGAAFPGKRPPDRQNAPGMTLRDWFAGQAVCSILAEQSIEHLLSEDIAQRAYQIADAMIEARKT